MKQSVPRPQSATHFWLALVAMCIGMGLVWLLGRIPALSRLVEYAPLIPCAGIIVVIGLSESIWPTLRAPSAGALTRASLRALSMRRVGVRLCGLAVTLGLLALAYWLLPEYAGDFYEPYWRFLRSVAPLAVLMPFYLMWADTRIAEPCDEYYAFGTWVLWQGAPQWPLIWRHLLGWLVKGFFLPLMTVYLANEVHALGQALDEIRRGSELMPVYQIFYHASYTVDLLFCVVGYSSAIRLLDSHIRSVEPTVAGWLVALMCYQPFYSVIGRFYLQYDDGTFWDNWLQAVPAVRDVWAVLIIALTVVYSLCTVAFGLRFSNLTHRGIITSGPYRFTKHPAYISKNISWWLISVPFVSELGWSAALRNCLLLGMLNAVYYARARTEERHLSADPTYVAYALWVNEHGMFKRLALALPFLRYRAPVTETPPLTHRRPDRAAS